MTFDFDNLIDRLRALSAASAPARWLVAYSGGIDSTVLLHAMAHSATGAPVLAVHIDHGLHPDSEQWERHCRASAETLGVDYISRRVVVDERSENGPEAAARQARYAALLSIVRDNDCLLSAHHEDDQAETLLLNLMRGSGPAGLAGIGLQQSFGRGRLLRPLLGVAGETINAYAREHDLLWIDDPSNTDTRFDRNFLRREVVPVLAARWPAVSNRLRRSAELVGEASELLEDLADIDLGTLGVPDRLSVGGMQELSASRQRNVLRRAVRLCGLPPPPATRLHQAIHELIPARADAQPLVTWSGVELRRFRDNLYIMTTREGLQDGSPGTLFRGDDLLALGPGMGSLALAETDGEGIEPALAKDGLTIRYRGGGEEMRISGEGPTRKLKKLLQEQGILPWMRHRLPLLYAGDKLVAVANLWVEAECTARPGLTVEWVDSPVLK